MRSGHVLAHHFAIEKCGEKTSPDLTSRDFNHLREEPGWLKLEPIIGAFLFLRTVSMKKKMLRQAPTAYPLLAEDLLCS